MHDRLAISAAIVVVAGCVLIAAGGSSAPRYEVVLLAGVGVSIYGAFHWYREFHAARRRSEEGIQSEALRKAIEDYKSSKSRPPDTGEAD